MDLLPPPLSRANRATYAERARTVKADIDHLLADVDDALGLEASESTAA